MSNDLIPRGSGSFLDELNLPKLLAGPAGEALSRLIGGAADIPAAWLQRAAQGVRDKTEAKSVVSKAVADAVAASVKNDPELIERATHSLLARGLRRQVAREAIARKTVVLLQEDEPPPGATADPKHHRVDEEWLNTFERYAEDASSERLQDLWARVLAGEIRKPGAFSLQTLRFVAELDANIAAGFERWTSSVMFGDVIPFPPREGPSFVELISLEEWGLVSGSTTLLNRTLSARRPGVISFPYRTHRVVVQVQAQQDFQFSAVTLTRVGREIYSLVHVQDDIEKARHFANELTKDNVLNIFYAPIAANGGLDLADPSLIRLWQKPA